MSDAYNDQKPKGYHEWRKGQHPEHFSSSCHSKSALRYNEADEKIKAEAPINKGTKFDSDKPKLSLIPAEALLELAKSMTYGADKYGAYNYKKGIEFRRLIDAAFRHLVAISDGEDIDAESGNSHLGHAMASLSMLAYMMKNKPEMDNRFKK